MGKFRKIKKNKPSTNNVNPTIDQVEPTSVFVVVEPSKCERENAAIRNKAFYEMKSQSTDLVAYRYLQTRQGRNNTGQEAATWSLFMFIALYFSQVGMSVEGEEEDAFNLLLIRTLMFKTATASLALFCFGNILPNIRNAIKYTQTNQGCAEWLEKKVSSEFQAQLTKLSYPTLLKDPCLGKLVDTLKEHKINTSGLENKMIERQAAGKYI